MYNASEAHGILIQGRNIQYRGESITASEVIGEICETYKMVKHDPALMMVALMIDPFGNDCEIVDILTYQQFCNLYPNIVRSGIAALKK
jgi:hypothetical protein